MLGWRPELALFIERQKEIGFVEAIVEGLDPWGDLPQALMNLKEKGMTIIPHVGGIEPIMPERIQRITRLAERLDAPFVSEHVAFVRADGVEAGHLLPIPRTEASLNVVVENIEKVKACLSVPLALENIASLLEWPGAEMTETEFFTEVLERTDTLMLLDVANVHANTTNHGGDPLSFLNRIPLDRLAYVHVAGGIGHDSLYHDTHSHPVTRPVLDILEELCRRVYVPGVLLERDDRFPTDEELSEELASIATTINRGNLRREECASGR